MEFIEKKSSTVEDEIAKYETEIITDVSFGKYSFCGNMSGMYGSGYVMTNKDTQPVYGNTINYFINLKIEMNNELFLETDRIYLYDYTGFLLGYTVNSLTKITTFLRKISKEHIGTNLRIDFSKKKILNEQELENLQKTMRRYPMDIIHSENITINDILQFGDTDCSICNDKIDDDSNKNIFSCGHNFHSSCVWKYLEVNDLLFPIDERCKKNCCDTQKSKNFNCPYCNKLIVTHYKN
jgi:hypothetical protein